MNDGKKKRYIYHECVRDLANSEELLKSFHEI